MYCAALESAGLVWTFRPTLKFTSFARCRLSVFRLYPLRCVITSIDALEAIPRLIVSYTCNNSRIQDDAWREI